MEYANVIIDISHEKVDRPFCYRVPHTLQNEVEVGSCVEVPFGKGNTLRKGYVIEKGIKPDFFPEKIKEIHSLAPDLAVEGKLIRLASWMKEEYGSTMIQALQTVLPVKKQVKKIVNRRIVSLLNEEELKEVLLQCEKRHQPAKVRLLQELLLYPQLPYSSVMDKLHLSLSTIRSLERDKIIKIESEACYRNPQVLPEAVGENKVLSPEQREIAEHIYEDYENKRYGTYLIHGITGSGKTEVYLELIEKVVKGGRSVIVLIPEIALTFQTVMRFKSRFGERVSMMNSSLSPGEKFDQCERARLGEIDVMIGPRSALFTPFKDVGLIVIDEEHETSYKSEITPRYHAREVAHQLARIHGASLVLGSATPSMESYYKAMEGEYGLFTLNKRLTGGSLPQVYVEDLREELRRGNRSIFSGRLRELIWDRLEKKEQIMLFLNRRGYAGFISCRSCGKVIKCPHCDVSLSRHQNGRMVCHYCGYEEKERKNCSFCGSPYLMGFKAGTEKIEEEFKKAFGNVPVLRMDRDTTRKKDSYQTILAGFMEEQAQVLIGTQMIVKGHDFPKVTLVGILAADLSLGVNDYRAAERTFQLLTQAAGRAGRGSLRGEVVIQTYQPEHYSIRKAADQDYEGFYQEEILYRSMAGYPPAANIMQIQIYSPKEDEGRKLGKQIRSTIARFCETKKVICIGPAPASIGRINDVYRFSLILKAKDKRPLIEARNLLENRLGTCVDTENIVQFDFNPMQAF